MSRSLLRLALIALCAIFCIAYPIAVIGVAFDVRAPFGVTWAGSALLILEGTLIAVAAVVEYGAAGLLAAAGIACLAYAVEALGVNTAFPFGAYHYSAALSPRLPGGVPLAVIFAWLMIILCMRGLSMRRARLVGGRLLASLLCGALCATLLDLVLEPVAFHVEHYWEWLAPGRYAYYGVPWANFAAWFVMAALMLAWLALALRRFRPPREVATLPVNLAAWLYIANLLMFGLVDLTHGYYVAAIIACIAIILPLALAPTVLALFPDNTPLAVVPAYGIEQYQAFKPKRKRVKQAKQAGGQKR
jgi:uncharacterized membrane protein